MFWWVLMKSWTKLGRDPSMQARSLAKISWGLRQSRSSISRHLRTHGLTQQRLLFYFPGFISDSPGAVHPWAEAGVSRRLCSGAKPGSGRKVFERPEGDLLQGAGAPEDQTDLDSALLRRRQAGN